MMFATSVAGCLYKDSLHPYNSSTQLTFTNHYQNRRRYTSCGEGEEECSTTTETYTQQWRCVDSISGHLNYHREWSKSPVPIKTPSAEDHVLVLTVWPQNRF